MLYLGLLVVSRGVDYNLCAGAWWGSPIYLDLTFPILLFNPMLLEIYHTIQNKMDLDNPPDYNQTILQVRCVHLIDLESSPLTQIDLNKPPQRPQHIRSPVTAVPSHPGNPQGLSPENRR